MGFTWFPPMAPTPIRKPISKWLSQRLKKFLGRWHFHIGLWGIPICLAVTHVTEELAFMMWLRYWEKHHCSNHCFSETFLPKLWATLICRRKYFEFSLMDTACPFSRTKVLVSSPGSMTSPATGFGAVQGTHSHSDRKIRKCLVTPVQAVPLWYQWAHHSRPVWRHTRPTAGKELW